MRWTKRQTDLIKQGQIDDKSPKLIYKELLLLSQSNSDFPIPSLKEFKQKYQNIQDYHEFYSVDELTELLNTSSNTIRRWFKNYSSQLKPINNKTVELKFLRKFIKQFPGEIVDNCQPELLWFISIL